MAWPQSFNINTLHIGVNSVEPSQLAWGTEVIYTSVIVKSCRAFPMITEVTIEQGGGVTATQLIINDGDEIEINVVDDRAITFPQPGTPVTLINPQPNGTAGTTETFMVVNNNYSVARKADGERTIMAKKYVLLTPTQM